MIIHHFLLRHETEENHVPWIVSKFISTVFNRKGPLFQKNLANKGGGQEKLYKP